MLQQLDLTEQEWSMSCNYPIFTSKSGVNTGHIRLTISFELEALTPNNFENCQMYS